MLLSSANPPWNGNSEIRIILSAKFWEPGQIWRTENGKKLQKFRKIPRKADKYLRKNRGEFDLNRGDLYNVYRFREGG